MDGWKEDGWMEGKKEDGQMENGWKEGRCMDALLLFNSHSHLVNTGRHHLIGLCFIALQRYCIFYKWKIRGNPALMNSIGTIFPTAFSRLMSLCHTLVILIIVCNFSLLLYFYGDLWLVIFDVTSTSHWMHRWWLAVFSNRVFFN